MRVQTEEWRRFVPGVRMYKGKKTLFYNGEKLYDRENEEYLIYDKEEQNSWEVIIVLPGVRVIPEWTFHSCKKIETVIMADTVQRIRWSAFGRCCRLTFVKLSRNLEYIRDYAFFGCFSLLSIFIPPSCTEIGSEVFRGCKKLIILHVPGQTQLGEGVIGDTDLIRVSSFAINQGGSYDIHISENVNEWIKNINENDEQFALHRACSSFNPITEVVYEIVKRRGLSSFKKKNQIGITPLEYLEANPFVEDFDQSAIMKRYVLEKMGETL
ncbi:hypothetical protein CTEN210_06535 [Chaetoceros tenuissimus]|uniref:Leucine-rich repeat domain-containing protein n=1 Tax=Chaetoceros tenuissimus TaxID=426638 RepID=A0AAD3H4W8_9STRA|nr:hypothetical protein CTEN210_06535 [Chaetoceros tenuissimus]